MIKKTLSFLFAAMLAGQALAQTTFTVGNLEYTVIEAEEHMVSVSAASSKPTGALTIESIVTNGNASYLVTEIGAYGFENCSGLTSLVLPESLTTIGQFAFNGCTGLTSITLPESLTTIKNNAFVNCQKVASFEIPNSVTTIGGYAFYNCYALTTLTIPMSATSVGAGLCSFCTKLTAITVEDGNPNYVSVDGVLYTIDTTQLVQYPIGKNSSSFVFPNTVTTIARSSFRGCTKLQNVTLSESLTSVAGYAFNKCSNLKTINIPSSVTCIDDHTFDGCQNLKTIAIPASVTTIKDGAFASCSSLTVYCETETKPAGWSTSGSSVLNSAVYGVVQSGDYIVHKNDSEHTAEIAGYIGASTSISIPETLEINGTSYSVTGIGGNAFKGSTSLTSIIVPATVTEISGSAFSGCSAAINIEGDNFIYEDNILFNKDKTVIICCLNPLTGTYEIPSTVKRISTFNAGSGLTSLTIPSTVETIDSAAFVGATGLTTITTSSQLDFRKALLCLVKDDIKYQVLAKDSVMVVANTYTGTVLIPPFVNAGNYFLVTTIGENAFYNNRNITSVTLPNTITAIPKSAFYSCTKLKAIALGNAVKSIGYSAFEGCIGLISLTIPKSTTYIDQCAFRSCSGLNRVFIPNSVTDMRYGVFDDCTSATIYCEAESEPNGWGIWNPDNLPVVWNSKGDSYSDEFFTFEITDTNKRTAKITGYTGTSANVIIPQTTTIEGVKYTVTTIGKRAFDGNKTLRSVFIPYYIDTVETLAFGNNYYDAKIFCEAAGDESAVPDGWDSNWYGLNMPAIEYNAHIDNGFVYQITDNSNRKAQIIRYMGENDTVVVPTEINGNEYAVSKIDGYTFYECTALKALDIPSSVTEIGNYAFYGSSNIESLTYNTDAIGDKFKNHKSLKTVHIGNNVTNIADWAFSNCSKLEEVTFSASVKTVGSNAFASCTNLRKVEFANIESLCGINFDQYESNPLENAHHLYVDGEEVTRFAIPSSVSSIGSRVFSGCTNIDSIFIPATVTTIGAKAFAGCDTLTIYCDVESKPDGWNETWNPNNRPVVWKTKKQWSVIAEANNNVYDTVVIDGSSITIVVTPATGYKFVKWSNGLTSDTITITVISDTTLVAEFAVLTWEVKSSANNSSYGTVEGSGTFDNGSKVTISATPAAGYKFVKWSNGLTSDTITITVISDTTLVAEFAVLTWEVKLSANNSEYGTVLGGGTFDNGSKVTISATPAAGYKFVKWSNGLTSASETIIVTSDLTLTAEFVKENTTPINPENPTDASYFTFNLSSTERTAEINGYTGSYTDIVIPTKVTINGEEYTVTAIADQTFRNSNITTVSIPNTVTAIGTEAFRGCDRLTEINIPDKVTEIGGGLFNGCSSLTKVNIPSSVASIRGYAFTAAQALNRSSSRLRRRSISMHL